METNQTQNWRLTVLETIKMMLVRPLMTNYKRTVRADYTMSACSRLPQPIKVLAHWLSVEGVSLWTGVPTQPPWMPASQIKQTLLSTKLVSLLAFEQRAARSRFLVTFWSLKKIRLLSLQYNLFCFHSKL